MHAPWDMIFTIIITLFASSGFWAFIASLKTKSSAEHKMILGIGYRSICELAGIYIARGYISREEYADLKKYLYEPYKAMGGNGTCERLMREVDSLPIKED